MKILPVMKRYRRAIVNRSQFKKEFKCMGPAVFPVIHVVDEWALDAAAAAAYHVDAILLDSGNPNKKVKELGGTGRTHNWDISNKIVNMVKVPVYLAGGLNPFNIVEAVDKVQPYGVDLCSGVRSDGKLDDWKLTAFFTALKKQR